MYHIEILKLKSVRPNIETVNKTPIVRFG